MQIREFRPGDEPALWQVFHSAIHGTAAADYTAEQLSAWSPNPPDLERWVERMRGIQPFIAEDFGQIVGYADLQESGYIDHFFVAAANARQGVGSRLMEQIHSTAYVRATPLLSSDVSITARPFFERWGFVVRKQQLVSVRGGAVTMTNFHMTKTLSPRS